MPRVRHHEDADVAVLDGADGSHHAIELQVLAHLVFASDACRIDEVEVEAKLVVARVDAVAGGSCYLGDDVAILADEGVDDARLADIGASHDGEARQVVVDLLLGHVLQFLQDDVEQVARAATRDCAHADRVAQSQLVKLGSLVRSSAIVYLVGHEQDGHACAAQDLCHILVPVRDARLVVHHEEHQVGLVRGYAHLLADGVLEDVVRLDDPASCIDKRKLAPVPETFAILAVAGGACRLAHDGAAAIGETVEKR